MFPDNDGRFRIIEKRWEVPIEIGKMEGPDGNKR
jgi:hypothetical protein